MTRSFKLAAIAAACMGCHLAAHALKDADDQSVNPFTGETIHALGLLGSPYSIADPTVKQASAVLIHRNWIIYAPHGGQARPGNTYAFEAGFAPGQRVTVNACERFRPLTGPSSPYAGDFALCRLASPMNWTRPFPPLVAMPPEIQPTLATEPGLGQNATVLRPKMAKWGYIAAKGQAWGNGLEVWKSAVVDFAGLPYGYDPAMGSAAPKIPYPISGDSGGAAYWLSPTATEPALAGLIASGYGQVPFGISYFTSVSLEWVRGKLAAAGDTDIRIITAAEHFSGPAGNAVAELSEPPRIASVNQSRSNFKITWPMPPADSAPVNAYRLTLGKAGQVQAPWTVNAGMGNTTPLNGLSGIYTLCVRPTGASPAASLAGVANFIRSSATNVLGVEVTSPNCRTFDTQEPLATMSAIGATTAPATSTTTTVTFQWTAGTPTAARYAIAQEVFLAGGITKKTSVETTQPTHAATVSNGNKVCVKVTPLNGIGLAGAVQSQCVTTTR